MCGIVGFTGENHSEVLQKMMGKIKHRGPDDQGFFNDGFCNLGHVRLSIIDLVGGHQPMSDQNGRSHIVFNGEIYNYRELKKELQESGFKFKTNSDTEVIIYTLQKYGWEGCKKLNGIFAFALWDQDQRKLILARDHLGVKPLYYALFSGQLYFSSELKSFLTIPQFKKEISLESLQCFLTAGYLPSPHTPFKNIFKLSPGQVLIWEAGNYILRNYWDLDDKEWSGSYDEAKASIRELVCDSVKRQCISERPLGVFLSGGIDSTLMAALAQQEVQGKLKTFTVGYEVEEQQDKYNLDLQLAKKTAKVLGTEHYEYLIKSEDISKEIGDFVYYLDEPNGSPTSLSNYLLARFARQKIVVNLGGDGGDELFAGYKRYEMSLWASRFQKMPQWMQNLPWQYLDRFYSRGHLKEKLLTPSGVKRYGMFRFQDSDAIKSLLNFTVGDPVMSWYEELFFQKEFSCPEKSLMYADLKSWLPDESLMRTDRMSMAHALESRVPLLDHRLVELAFSLPLSWKVRGGVTKRILRETFSDILPEHLLKVPKQGWFSPVAKWLRGPLAEQVKEVLQPENINHDYFNKQVLDTILREHLQKEKSWRVLLWNLFIWQAWYDTFIEDKHL